MKKFIISAAFAIAAIAAYGQTVNDAINMSRENLYGTARSASMGNAMTAVGGDVGAMSVNPAGSAVVSSNVFTLTPGFSISSTSSSFSPAAYSVLGGDSKYGAEGMDFGVGNRETASKMTLPNVGTIIRYETGRSGLKAVTFGFAFNQTYSYTGRSAAFGVNPYTSIGGAFAAQATYNADGFGSSLDPGVDFSKNPYDNPFSGNKYYSWNVLSAYESFMAGYAGEDSDGRYQYIAAACDGPSGTSPTDCPLKGDLDQYSKIVTGGAKRDLLVNLGWNWEDSFYFGLTMGIPICSYSYSEFFREAPVDPEQFPTVDYFAGFLGNLTNQNYRYDYNSNFAGIYGKFGIIWLPGANLRLGATIKTPTVLSVDESWYLNSQTVFENNPSEIPAVHNGHPVEWGSYEYMLRTPWSFSLGAAYTFGPYGLLSVDYELTDYSVMKYSSRDSDNDYYYGDAFKEVNTLMNLFCGVSHTLKVGGELRLNPMFSLRAGFNMQTSPMRYYRNEHGEIIDAYAYDYYDRSAILRDKKAIKAPVYSYSVGIGYSSPGSFFVDALARLNTYPTSYMAPYASYNENYASALISSQRRLWDVAVTFGWRF